MLILNGLYKSTDDGENWTSIASTLPGATSGTPSTYYDPNNLRIGADNTIWMSTKVNVYGFGGGAILKSSNGVNFTLEHEIPNGQRTEIAPSPTNANTIYVLAELSSSSNPVGMYKTSDAFSTTTSLALPNDADNGIPANDFTRGQAFYDLLLRVDPTNEDILYTGGIDLFKSSDGGTSWNQISKWSNNNNLASLSVSEVHADQHGLSFSSSSKMVFSNDGGVYFSNDSGSTINERNNGYNTLQFYTMAVATTTSITGDYFVAGAQDNGSQYFQNAASTVDGSVDVFGGDGAACFFDQDGTDDYFIVNYVYNIAIGLFDASTGDYRKPSITKVILMAILLPNKP